MLADVETVVARVKQSRLYRRAGAIFVLWGVLFFGRQALFVFAPQFAAHGWFSVDIVGVALTVLMLRDQFNPGGRFPLRLLAAFALFYGFGWIWSDLIGGFGGRQMAAFWPTLFQFGYAVAGLWFGAAFVAIGLGATALTLADFLWAGEWFFPLLALINGGALIAAGLWMRRA
jgi:hypothetical protein